MIIPIPFDINRHIMLHRTVRSRGGRGGMINLPKHFIGQKAIILLALYEDEEETEKWFDAVTKPYRPREQMKHTPHYR